MAYCSSSSVSIFLFFSVALLLSFLPIEARNGISSNKITRAAAAAATAPSPAEFTISSSVADDSDNAFPPVESYAADGPSLATAPPPEFTISTVTDDSGATGAPSPASGPEFTGIDTIDDSSLPADEVDDGRAAPSPESTSTGITDEDDAYEYGPAWAPSPSPAPATLTKPAAEKPTTRLRRMATSKVPNRYYDQYDGKNIFYRREFRNKGKTGGVRETQDYTGAYRGTRANNYNYNYNYNYDNKKSDLGKGNKNVPNSMGQYFGKMGFEDLSLYQP